MSHWALDSVPLALANGGAAAREPGPERVLVVGDPGHSYSYGKTLIKKAREDEEHMFIYE